jgi:hypothetical protein
MRKLWRVAGRRTPSAATLADVQALIASHTFAMPSFASQGGPFMGREGWVETGNGGHGGDGAGQGVSRLAWPLSHSLPAGQRAALAALQALLPQHRCQFSTDAMEGTARGAWALSQWGDAAGPQFLSPIETLPLPGLAEYQVA